MGSECLSSAVLTLCCGHCQHRVGQAESEWGPRAACPSDPQAAGDLSAGSGAPGCGLLCPSEPGGWLGHHHSGAWQVQRWGGAGSSGAILTSGGAAGGILGAAALGSLLSHTGRLPPAGREGVVVVWASLQLPWGPYPGRTEQWIHACLLAVPGLRVPGGQMAMWADLDYAPRSDLWTPAAFRSTCSSLWSLSSASSTSSFLVTTMHPAVSAPSCLTLTMSALSWVCRVGGLGWMCGGSGSGSVLPLCRAVV